MTHILIGFAIVVVLALAITGLIWAVSIWLEPDAYIYVPEGVALAELPYNLQSWHQCKVYQSIGHSIW